MSVIEKLGHNVTVYHEVAPTCTQNGSTSYEACSRCDYSTPSEIITSLGHNYSSEWTVDIEATEDSEGEKSHHCIRCDSRVNVTVIPKTVNSSEIFSDIPANEWFKKSVDFVVSNGLMNGIGGDTFDPNGTMTRAMVVTVLYRMENSPEVTSSVPFNDLKESWYEAAVAWAYKNNIVNGTGPNTFDPYGEITREQLATILHRYSEYKKYEVSLNEDIDMNFPDLNKTNSWAEAAIAWAVSEGLITGSNEGGIILLKPDGDATRAQVATILTRFCNKH